MKKNKIIKLSVIIVCAAVVIAAFCLYIFRTQSIAGIISIDKANITITEATAFYAQNGENLKQVYATNNSDDVNKVVELLSSAKARLIQWRPFVGALPLYAKEKDVYSFVLDDNTDYNIVLYFANGCVYYNDSKYKISDEDADRFSKDLQALCSESGTKTNNETVQK